MSVRKAVVLLSGGMDSATTAAIAAVEGFEIYALTIRYGQRHAAEVAAARATAARLGVRRHLVIDVDLSAFGGSALTGEIAVPKDRTIEAMAAGIPATYVPARNTIFLSLALAWAETLDAGDIFIGINALDYSGYPDCRPEFVAAFERLALLATRSGLEEGRAPRVRAPLISLSKREIVERGQALGIDYALTLTCYDPDANGAACGHCDACLLRLRGFAEAGLTDPANYRRESVGDPPFAGRQPPSR